MTPKKIVEDLLHVILWSGILLTPKKEKKLLQIWWWKHFWKGHSQFCCSRQKLASLIMNNKLRQRARN